MPVARVLLVANKTASAPALVEAVRRRARCTRARFHLVVPATPQGLHRIVDPEVAGIEARSDDSSPRFPSSVRRPGNP